MEEAFRNIGRSPLLPVTPTSHGQERLITNSSSSGGGGSQEKDTAQNSRAIKKRARTKKNPVWDMVQEDENNQHRCKLCDIVVKSASSGNILQHLEQRHPEAYQHVKEQERIDKAADAAQPGCSKASSRAEKFEKTVRLFVLTIGTSTIPISIVENDFFKLLMNGCLRFTLPSRPTVRKHLLRECENVRATIKRKLAGCRRVSIEMDISTVKGFHRPYLNVLVHYIDEGNGVLCHNLLDVVELQSSHTAVQIKECVNKVLEDYDIPVTKIIRYVGDNGANIKAAFQEKFTVLLPGGEMVDNDGLAQLSEGEMEQMIVSEWLQDESSDETDSGFGIASEEAVTEDEESFHKNMTLAFSRYVPCTIHSLMLVLRSVLEVDTFYSQLKKEVFAVVKQFSHSHLLTKDIIKESKGRKLLLPCDTRWLSVYMVYRRVLELAREVNAVCGRNNVKTLSPETQEDVRSMVELLTPFNEVVLRWQNSRDATINHVYPSIRLLECHLLNYAQNEGNSGKMVHLADKLRLALQIRFAHVLHSGEENNDPLFILATFLDGSMARVIPLEQRNSVVTVAKALATAGDINADPQFSPPAIAYVTSTAPEGVYAHLMVQGEDNCPLVPTGGAADVAREVDRYVADGAWRGPRTGTNIVKYWTSCAKLYPALSTIALDVLSVPASSSEVEKSFSQVTVQSSSHKSSVAPMLLRARVMLSFNRDLIVV